MRRWKWGAAMGVLSLCLGLQETGAQNTTKPSKIDMLMAYKAGTRPTKVTPLSPQIATQPAAQVPNPIPGSLPAQQPTNYPTYGVERPVVAGETPLTADAARVAALEKYYQDIGNKIQALAKKQETLGQEQGNLSQQQQDAAESNRQQLAQLTALMQNNPDTQALKQQIARLLSGQNDLKTKVTEVLESPNLKKYVVEVEVDRDPQTVEVAYRAVASANFNVVTLLPEYVDGVIRAPSIVDVALEGTLADKEFKVYPWHFAALEDPFRKLVDDTVKNVPPALQRLGQHFLANTIIVGRMDVTSDKAPDRGGTFWCQAKATIRVIKDGRILTTMVFPDLDKENEEIKGYGRDKDAAAEKALRRLAREVKDKLPAKMLKDFPRYPTTLQFALTGTGPERLMQIKEIQERLRQVVGSENLKVLETTDSTYLLSATTPFNRAELGARLEAKTPYRIEAVAGN